MLLLLFALCVLPTGALADEAELVGQWTEQNHAKIWYALDLAEDGRFTFHLDVVLEDDYWEDQPILPELVEGLDTVRLTYSGQWEVQDGLMILTADAFVMTVNGESFLETIMDAVFETFRIKEGLSQEQITGLKVAGRDRLKVEEKSKKPNRLKSSTAITSTPTPLNWAAQGLSW